LEYPGGNFPLLSYGKSGSGTLVYAQVMPANVLVLAVDQWGYHLQVSRPIHGTPQVASTIDILIGPLIAAHLWPKDWGLKADALATLGHRLQVWLNGTLVFTCDLDAKFDPDEHLTDVGLNTEGFSSAQEQYPYSMTPVPVAGALEREILDRSLRP
jgi:hypothetical protein